MSLPLKATAASGSAVQELDAWFVGLGDDFIGRVSASSLRTRMVEGWRLRWRERELEIQVDADFPYSVARVYLVGYSRAQAQPHIEKDGKLCLGSKAVPGDRVRTVKVALAEAFRLLTENDTRQHDDDLREDFGLYWLTWASRADLRVEVMPGPEGARKSILGRAAVTEERVFVFPGKTDAGRFCTNLTGEAPKWLKETPVISIDPLPAPNRYPETAEELWALVDARSQGGTDLLARLMANAPLEAFVVLAGKAPSGREHYAAVRLRRPLDRGGQPLKRRAMREGIEQTEDPTRGLFGRFKIERLTTQRMDSSSSRLPEGAQRRMATAKVVIVGCGALGSGVARMLAQAGVEHLRLVDPENLGWENIRRHELGGRTVGFGKAKALAGTIRADLPMIGFAEGYETTFATFAREHPDALKQADLIVSCTGDWAADASVEHALAQPGHKAAAVYGWMEAHALAAHAVLIGNLGARLAEGFADSGEFRLSVVAGGKPPPPGMRRSIDDVRRGRTLPRPGSRRQARDRCLARTRNCAGMAVVACGRRRVRGSGSGGRLRLGGGARAAGRHGRLVQRRVEVSVSGPNLTFKVGRISVRIGAQALATFDAHRQRRFFQREAGGQLFARVRDNDWEIVTATGPRSRDRRSRFSFWPHRASEQEEIFEHHALGLDYVGDWHTHPEDTPTPSPDDLTSIAEVVRRSTHHLPGFLLMIVGRTPYPEGLWASFHFIDGTRLEAAKMRLLSGPEDPPPAPLQILSLSANWCEMHKTRSSNDS